MGVKWAEKLAATEAIFGLGSLAKAWANMEGARTKAMAKIIGITPALFSLIGK